MDFGLFFLMQRDEQWSERAVYNSGLEQMLAAEALGYSSVWIAEHHSGGSVPGSFDRSRLRLRAFSDYLADGWALVGSSAEVREGLQQYLDATGYRHVLLLMALPGLDTELALRSMRLFAEEVAPALASAGGRVVAGP